jgi:hypothetical protein
MADELTVNLGLIKPEIGGSDDTWGEKLHYNFDIIDAAIKEAGSGGDSGGNGDNGTSVTISESPPSTSTPGNLWWESDTGILYIYYDDGTSSQWVSIGGGSSSSLAYTSDTAPPNPVDGMLWWRSSDGVLLVYYDNGVSPQWMPASNLLVHTSDIAPSNPKDGTLWWRSSDGVLLIYYDDGTPEWTLASPASSSIATKNYILNSAMMVSQQNGSTALPLSQSGTPSGYPVDEWQGSLASSGTLTVAQVASTTPAGSPNRIRCTVSVADTTVDASDLILLIHRIEGFRIADLMSGTASAKTVTLAFGVKAPAGTYGVTFYNSAANRSRVETFTIAAGEANTDVRKTITLPLDTTGAWQINNLVGLTVAFVLMCGTNNHTTAGAWAATWKASTSAQFNLMASTSNIFELFDVSLTVGTTAPAFVVPNYQSELTLCKRYYKRFGGKQTHDLDLSAGYIDAADYARFQLFFDVEMRDAPTFSLIGTWSYQNVTGALTGGYLSADTASLTLLATAGGKVRGWNNAAGAGFSFNARL